MAQVSLRGVTKSYGGVPVIHGIDLEIEDGEFIVVVGPSGCGKSTLLRMVAGLEEISGGEVAIAGRVVNRLEPKDRDIAMVFQNYALYPHMTVFDNMAYGLRIRGLGKAEIVARVGHAAAVLQLDGLLQRRPRQLSGGQRQRVAMGRAIVRDPQVFLFDEPLSNLDAKLRVQMRLEIRKLHQELRTTSIYVTHDQVEAMTLADRLVVMNAGLAEQVGSPKQVYDRPVSRYVAGFIGSPAMNFLPATVVAGGAALQLAEGQRLDLPAALPATETGRRLTLGIRPEHLRLLDQGLSDKGSPGSLALTVEVAEELGADTLVHGVLGGAALVARLPGLTAVVRGDRLWFAVEPRHLHLFDADSGQRLTEPPQAVTGPLTGALRQP